MKKITKWARSKYIDLMFWWNRVKLEKELGKELQYWYNTTGHEIYQDDTQKKYAEGLYTVKNKINSLAANEDYDKVLKEVKDLIGLSRKETTSQRTIRKIITNMTKLPEKSRSAMIKDRIGHYEELRKYNEERALIKEIKQTRKEGDEQLAKELEEKWRNAYGKIRNPR